MARGRAEMDVGLDGVAVITIVNPPVNALSFDVLICLKEHYGQALKREDVRAIVLTGANGRFCGGFDINAFQSGTSAKEKLGISPNDFLNDYIEGAKKPTVSAMDGLALGGGLEIAMACHGRICTPNTQLGLPELQLGIIPGMGGTQRLPRLVGLFKSLEIMLQSKSIKGEEAKLLGLVNAIVDSKDLISTARSLALEIATCKKPWIKTLYRNDKLPTVKEAREIFKIARTKVQKRDANLEHPLVCIDVVEEGIVSGPKAGLIKEGECAKMLQNSQTSKSLMHFFFAQRATSKVPGITDIGLVPRKIKSVGIVGGGLMGTSIATLFILNNFPVILKEKNDIFLQASLVRVRENLQRNLTRERLDKALNLLNGVVNYEQFGDLDIIIEAVEEDVLVKQKIFCDLEKCCSSRCIFATSSSNIDLNLIGQKTSSHDRILGAHFVRPADEMPILEIIRTPKTSPQVVLDLLHLAKILQKTPIVLGNYTAVNRMFVPYTQVALFLVDLGVDSYLIDGILAKFGMSMGPFPKSRRISSFAPDPEVAKISEKAILEMILFAVINEACLILEEGISIKSSDLDIASILGMGFPSYRGGIMFWADSLGMNYVHKRLEAWSTKYGKLFEPSNYLKDISGLSLGAGVDLTKSRL